MLKKIAGLIFPVRGRRKPCCKNENRASALKELLSKIEVPKEPIKQKRIVEDFSEAVLEQKFDAAGNIVEQMQYKNLIELRFNMPYEECLGNTGFLEEDRERIERLKKVIIVKGYRPSRQWCGYYRKGRLPSIIRFLVREKIIFFKVYAPDFSFGDSDTIGPPYPTPKELLRFLRGNGIGL